MYDIERTWRPLIARIPDEGTDAPHIYKTNVVRDEHVVHEVGEDLDRVDHADGSYNPERTCNATCMPACSELCKEYRFLCTT